MITDDAKGPVATGVDRVGAICRRFGIDSLAPQLAACGELLGGGGVVDVAVLGQFKAGKSSFLNGLIGAAVVPEGIHGDDDEGGRGDQRDAEQAASGPPRRVAEAQPAQSGCPGAADHRVASPASTSVDPSR